MVSAFWQLSFQIQCLLPPSSVQCPNRSSLCEKLQPFHRFSARRMSHLRTDKELEPSECSFHQSQVKDLCQAIGIHCPSVCIVLTSRDEQQHSLTTASEFSQVQDYKI